ncbi:MAG: HEAT repeat domain-containing protein [Thermodesulfovibrionales bacterium]
MDNTELREMIAEYMEKGFLENIIDMFKHDSELYYMIADLIRDERIRVRLGVTALVETLSQEDKGNIKRAIPNLIKHIKDDNPVVRGDVANLIGIIGDNESIPYLMTLLNDADYNVREIAQEAITEIRRRI